MSELENIAKQMVAKGKGILAADESTGTMTKRLAGVSIESTPESRLKFRETLFSAEGMKNYIGGVILYDETIKQKTSSGKTIPDLIKSFGSIPGIKVDTGAKILAGSAEEKITEGLDGLRERLKEYYKLGAKFTKWRGVYNISEIYPSKLSIQANAHALARYSALVQECNMVPIVEPEVLMEGPHNSKVCLEKNRVRGGDKMGLIALTAKVVAVVALYMSLMLGVAFAQTKLPWQTDSLITLSAEDEDIKDVLRTILRSNRMVTIFKGAVEGTIDLDEEDVPEQGNFNKIKRF